MTATPYGELIARLREATGADRELDAEIAVATTETRSTADDLIYAHLRSRDGSDATHPGNYFMKSRSGASCASAPPYTASIDAALTLVPEGWWAEIQARPDNPHVRLWEFPQPCREVGWINAATPALALCIAALLARAALAGAQP